MDLTLRLPPGLHVSLGEVAPLPTSMADAPSHKEETGCSQGRMGDSKRRSGQAVRRTAQTTTAMQDINTGSPLPFSSYVRKVKDFGVFILQHR